MFYCDECAEKCAWPKTFAKWRGHCEMCGKFDQNMSDLPSSVLPRAVEIPERNAAGDKE